MFGMKNADPPDPINKKLYEDDDDLDADIGARRRGRRAIHKEISPYNGDKPLKMKEKFEARTDRNLAEKKFLESKNLKERSKIVLRAGVREIIKSGYGKENADLNFIDSELEAMENAIKSGQTNDSKILFQHVESSKSINDLVEERGYVFIQATSDMV